MYRQGRAKAISQFLQPKVQFLGHVPADGILQDPSKMDQVKEWPISTAVREA